MAAQPKSAPHYGAVVPHLRVRGAAEAIAYYKKAFGAKRLNALRMGERLGHAEIEIGGTTIFLADEFPEMGAVGPKTLKGTTVTMVLMVKDADRTVAKAVAAGGKLRQPVADMFYGFRAGQIEDPFGHVWLIQHRIEEVEAREMQRRMNTMMKAHQATGGGKKRT